MKTSPPRPLYNVPKFNLSKKDKVMKKLINDYKDGSLVTRNDVFFSLCKSIIGQQISVAAANSVFLRFKKKCKNKINARTVSKLSFSNLKSCGLSKQKAKGIKDLAKRTLNKTFKPSFIKKMTDEEAGEFQLSNGAMDQFRSFLFSRVMPNLKKIGLLTDSVRPKYEALGILEYEHAPSDFECDWAEMKKPLEKFGQIPTSL